MSAASRERVRLTEVGPRDGLQNEARLLDVERRVALVERLVEAGLSEIEVGSFVHPRWVPQMAGTDELARKLPRREGVDYWGLVPNLRGFERALAAGITHVSVVVSASETHNQKNINRSRDETLAGIEAIAARCRAEKIALRAYVSTAFGCPYEGHVPFAEVLELSHRLADLGVEGLSLGDTVGVGRPRQVAEGCARALDEFGAELVILHLHDTKGLGITNAYAAAEAGVRRFDASAGGLGGCPYAPGASGNVASEELVHLLEGLGFDTGVDLDRLAELARWVNDKLEIPVASRYARWAAGNSCAID